jgi:hypothetical protein
LRVKEFQHQFCFGAVSENSFESFCECQLFNTQFELVFVWCQLNKTSVFSKQQWHMSAQKLGANSTDNLFLQN